MREYLNPWTVAGAVGAALGGALVSLTSGVVLILSILLSAGGMISIAVGGRRAGKKDVQSLEGKMDALRKEVGQLTGRSSEIDENRIQGIRERFQDIAAEFTGDPEGFYSPVDAEVGSIRADQQSMNAKYRYLYVDFFNAVQGALEGLSEKGVLSVSHENNGVPANIFGKRDVTVAKTDFEETASLMWSLTRQEELSDRLPHIEVVAAKNGDWGGNLVVVEFNASFEKFGVTSLGIFSPLGRRFDVWGAALFADHEAFYRDLLPGIIRIAGHWAKSLEAE